MSHKTIVNKVLHYVLNYILERMIIAHNIKQDGLNDPTYSAKIIELKLLSEEIDKAR